MGTTKRAVLGCLGVAGLVFVGIGTLAVLNWDSVSRNLGEAWNARAEKTQVTLFRLGEVMSIGAELKAEYGTEPDVSYDTETGHRVLGISFSDYRLPGNVTTRAHAREIATFAIGKTKKLEQIDAVEVSFRTESYTFAPEDLMPTRPQAKPGVPDRS